MNSRRRFWQESDSTGSFEDPFNARADDARARQQMIGAELRQAYRKIADEPVPAEWLDLLREGEDSPENGRAQQHNRIELT